MSLSRGQEIQDLHGVRSLLQGAILRLMRLMRLKGRIRQSAFWWVKGGMVLNSGISLLVLFLLKHYLGRLKL